MTDFGKPVSQHRWIAGIPGFVCEVCGISMDDVFPLSGRNVLCGGGLIAVDVPQVLWASDQPRGEIGGGSHVFDVQTMACQNCGEPWGMNLYCSSDQAPRYIVSGDGSDGA